MLCLNEETTAEANKIIGRGVASSPRNPPRFYVFLVSRCFGKLSKINQIEMIIFANDLV